MTEAKATVLVIDDDAPVREVLRRFLAQAGYDVNVAENGAAALQLVHSSAPPDVIVLDLMMPVMSGFEVLSALRVHPDWSNIPVVVLTATMGYSADHLQADALLVKPFEMPMLEAAIEKAISSRRSRSSGGA